MRSLAFLLISLLIPASFIHTSSSAQQEATVYVCPMHPEVQSSKMGNCPKCEMKLVAAKLVATVILGEVAPSGWPRTEPATL